MQRARSSFGAAATIGSAAAAAAERLHDPAELPLKYWAVLAVLALIGWGASSLPLLAGWRDGAAVDRLRIVQGILVAAAASGLAFTGALMVGLPLAAGYVSAFLAAYGGDRYLARRADRELERSDPPR